jgi:hypothetical protein
MDAEKRAERLEQLQENTEAAFRLLTQQVLTVEQARAAVDILQLQADLSDLSDSATRRRPAR